MLFWENVVINSIRISNCKTLKRLVLQWIIVFVLIFIKTWKQHKCYYPLLNTKFWPFSDGLLHLCWYWENVIINTFRIFKYKTLKNTSFAMDYSICANIKKKFKTAQMLLSIVKHEILNVLQWIIIFVQILIKCYKQHKPCFQVQNAQKYIFYNGS